MGLHSHSNSSSAPADRGWWKIGLVLLALWLIGWTICSWGAIQDDALIHLRYAHNLLLWHFVTYDGVHPNYGASSLLYITLLALLSAFSSSPELPHVVSAVVHLLIIAALAGYFATARPRLSTLARTLWILFLCLLVTPSAVRWLQDGMETGVVLASVLLLAALCFFWSRTIPGPARLATLGAMGCLLVLLRVELLLLTSLAALIFLLRAWPVETAPRKLSSALFAPVSLLAGSALACGIILSRMHFLLPDTALAKSHGLYHWQGSLTSMAIVLGGGFSFGAGLCLFWLLTLLLLGLRSRRLGLPALVANSVFPVLLLLAALKGQAFQGARYLDWTFAFPILWNLLEIGSVVPAAAPSTPRERTLTVSFAVLLLLILPFESANFYRILRDRAHTMNTFRSQHLERLRGYTLIAGDIGFIGYFTGSDVCDINGLVDGRDFARLTTGQRVQSCIQRHPQLAFLGLSQLRDVAAHMNLQGWQVCDVVGFFNIRTRDPHYLISSPELSPLACQSTGNKPFPVAKLLPATSSPAAPVH